MEQLGLFSDALTEKQVFESLEEALTNVIEENNLSVTSLTCKTGKFYSSVWYGKQLAFRICSRDETHYFGVSDSYAAIAPAEFTPYIATDRKAEGFTNYAFPPTIPGVAFYRAFLCSVLNQAIDNIPKDFDCCSRYEVCSDAGRCINPNPDMAAGCGYRKIMKSGRIFYGKNRNID